MSVNNSQLDLSGIYTLSSKESLILLTLPDTFFLKKICLVLQKVLALHGAAKVSAYVTHAVFPKQSYERFMASSSGNWQFIQLSNSEFFLLLIMC
jgi:hypothetical protein